jgi:oligopeptide/dipeptide ABC transporter ATP-binding protein
MDAAAPAILEIENLATWFETSAGRARAVDGVSLRVEAGETLCIVGESGCGKSVTALSIMGLVPHPGRIVAGEVRFHGENLLALDEREIADYRGNRISMIFQDPSSSLNPVHTVGRQVSEVYRLHKGLGRAEAEAAAARMLASTGIPDPEARMRAYPHELSGGMAQRVMIAMALACRPEVLIADEPTTALDVTIQAQILDLMRELQAETGTALVLITHDLGIVAEMADHVAVMYAGQVVEFADVKTLFSNPKHPYTKALLRSIPAATDRRQMLEVIDGRVPNLTKLPAGCRFAPRCKARIAENEPRGVDLPPPLFDLGNNHFSRCWLSEPRP